MKPDRPAGSGRPKKLTLRTNTLRVVRAPDLSQVGGGMTTWTMISRDLRTSLSCDCEGTD